MGQSQLNSPSSVSSINQQLFLSLKYSRRFEAQVGSALILSLLCNSTFRAMPGKVFSLDLTAWMATTLPKRTSLLSVIVVKPRGRTVNQSPGFGFLKTCRKYWCPSVRILRLNLGGRGERYPNWFNSIFEFCQKIIQFNIQFNSISRKFNSKDYPIQYFSQKFNSKNYSIQKNSKKFNSKNYSIQKFSKKKSIQ